MPGQDFGWRTPDVRARRQEAYLRSLDRVKIENSAGLYVNRPDAGTVGTLYLASDSPVVSFDTGDDWSLYGPLYAFTPPVDDEFAWVNQGSAELTDEGWGLYLSAPHSAATSLRCRVKEAPATPYTITAYLMPALANKATHSAGLLFRESGTGEIHTFDWSMDGGAPLLRSTKFASATSLTADYQSVDMPGIYPWLKIADDATDRVCSYSSDGVHWVEFHSIGRTDHLTADQVGFCVAAENAGTPNLEAGLSVLSWVEGEA